MDIIIDAYNLIFQCGLEGRTRDAASVRKSRSRLLELLVATLPIDQRRRTTIVFDARKLPVGERHIDSRRHEIRVLFSVGYSDADSMIEELIASHSHPKQLLVVSSDHRIQTAATRRKATPIDSDVWLDRIEKEAASAEASDCGVELKPHQSKHDWRAEFDVESPEASQALVRQIEDELASESKATEPDDLNKIEQQFKDIDWMREFGFEKKEDR